MEMNAIEEYGKRKEEKGYKEGRKLARKEIILKLTENGIEPEEITRITKINLNTIQRIIDNPEQDY